MKILFIFILIIGSIYFLIKKRHIDVFTIAFFSGVIYFSPGIVGEIILPYKVGTEIIIGRTYLAMSTVLISFIIFSMIFDCLGIKYKRPNLQKEKKLSLLYFTITLLLFLIMLFKGGKSLFSDNKAEIAANHNRFRMLYQFSSAFGLVYFIAIKKKIYASFFIFYALFNNYIGNRSHTAMAIIAIILILNIHKKESFFLRNKVKILKILILGAFIFITKGISGTIRAGNLELLKRKITSLEFYKLMFLNGEPNAIQLILNTTIRESFYMGTDIIKSYLTPLIPFFNEVLGQAPKVYSYEFRSIYYPYVKYGMGSNIWGEAYSITGSMFSLIVFLIIYNILLMIFNYYLFNIKKIYFKCLIAFNISYFTFYINRHNFSYQIITQKRILIVPIFVYLIYVTFFKKRRSHDKNRFFGTKVSYKSK